MELVFIPFLGVLMFNGWTVSCNCMLPQTVRAECFVYTKDKHRKYAYCSGCNQGTDKRDEI